MGLRDVFNGILNGPRGQRQPSRSGGSGGRSPIMIGLLGLLAYLTLRGRGGPAAPPDSGNNPRDLRPPPRRWL
jgi:hypothetical protein